MDSTTSTTNEYHRLTPNSRRLFERACRILPSGTTRAPFFYKPYPFYAKRAIGCRIWDMDDREYIDFVNNYGPLILGHRHPRVTNAVKEQLDIFWSGAPTEIEIALAEEITKRVHGAEYVQFFPSGTEACQYALRTARAYSGKDRFVMIDGGYHGSSDHFLKSKGIPRDLREKALSVPFNNVTTMEKVVEANKDKIAAVFLEAVLGSYGIAPEEGYLREVRRITEENDVLLILDEVVTGFRLAPGGAQERFKITADMCTFGKVIGGGFACGAMTFPKEISELFKYPDTPGIDVGASSLPHPGTFNSVAVTLAAGLATIQELTPNTYDHLENIGNSIRSGLKKILSDLGIRAEISGIASLFNIHFTQGKVVDAKSAEAENRFLHRLFDLCMLNRGINLCKAHDSFCSAPMTNHEVIRALSAAEDSLKAMRPVIREIAPELLE